MMIEPPISFRLKVCYQAVKLSCIRKQKLQEQHIRKKEQQLCNRNLRTGYEA
jgi:hypothetical protein